MRYYISVLFLIINAVSAAQDYKRTFNWYFGDSAGLSFATTPPLALTNSALKSWQGCSSISDSNGNIQFYTNGQTIWNRFHQVMQNGLGLKGDPSSTQATVIIPAPKCDSIFYVFTTDVAAQANGLMYSVVNLNANGGAGNVIVKNKLLKTPTCEKLAATLHANGSDVWLLAHDFGNNTFRAYLVTGQGIIECPVLSNAGSSIDTYVGNTQGEMKFSRDGKKIFSTIYTSDKIEVLDFNTYNGKVSPTALLTLRNILQPYSMELSLNMKRLYVTDRGKNLYQFNLELGNEDSINSHRYTISSQMTDFFFNSIQMGIDNKIYVAIYDSSFIGTIQEPDSIGSSTDFQLNGINLNGKKSWAGFPNFISNYFNILAVDFSYTFTCGSHQATLSGKTSVPQSVWQWKIRNLADNSVNSFNSQNLNYTFPDSGWYEVQLKAGNDSITKQIYVEGELLPVADKYFTCGADSFVLVPNGSYRCLVWNDTLSVSTFTVKQNGTYKVSGYNLQGCWITDSVQVFFVPPPPKPIVSRLKDSIISTPAKSYQWFRNNNAIAGAASQRYKPTQNDWYQITITDSNDCSNTSDSFYVGFVGIPTIKADEKILCYPNPATDELTVELSKFLNETIEQIELWNITGQQVKRIVQPDASRVAIPCKQLPKGVYFIQVQTNNTHTYHNKIVIQ